MKNTRQNLKNLCGNITGHIDLDKKTFHIEENKTGHYVIESDENNRVWITTPEFAEHLYIETKATIYACPRPIDASEVSLLLKDNNQNFNLYIPNIDHIWHRFAVEQRIPFVHTDDKKLNFQYLSRESSSVSEEKLFINNDSMKTDGGIKIATTSTSAHYQNHLLGGPIKPIANAVLGYKKIYFQTKYSIFYETIRTINHTLPQLRSYSYIDSEIIEEKLNEQVSFYDEFPHVDSNNLHNLNSGLFIWNQTEASGKTGAIAADIKATDSNSPILAITNTESLTGELSDRLGCTSYKDIKSIMTGWHNNKVATCLNSLTNPVIRSFSNDIEYVFFDEFLSILDALASGSHISETERPKLLDEIIRIIKETPKIAIADANLNQAAVDFIKTIRSDIHVVDFDYKNYKKPDAIFYNSQEKIIQKIVNRMPQSSECITIFTDTKRMAFIIEKALSKEVKNLELDDIALLHAENKSGDEHRTYTKEFWGDIDCHLMNYKVLISSPVIGSGISLEENTDENTFCFFSAHLNIPAYLQQIARNRRAKTLHIYFDEKSEYEGELIDSNKKLSLIGQYNSLDVFNLTRQQTEQDIQSNKIEFLMRSMLRKGYSLSWDKETTISIKTSINECSKEAKNDRVMAVQNSSDKIILDPEYQSKINKQSRTTQSQSDEITRFNIAKIFFDDPDINTSEKINVLPESFNVLRNLELIRSSLPTTKALDEADTAIASKKRNYVHKRDFLLILDRAKKPSKTVCKNIIKELLLNQNNFQIIISANMQYWQREIDTIDHVLIVSRLCKKHLGFELKKEGKKINVKASFDWKEVDDRRKKHNFSMLKNSLENDQIFYNFFQKKMKDKNTHTPYRERDSA
jgi:hypothetical protein